MPKISKAKVIADYIVQLNDELTKSNGSKYDKAKDNLVDILNDIENDETLSLGLALKLHDAGYKKRDVEVVNFGANILQEIKDDFAVRKSKDSSFALSYASSIVAMRQKIELQMPLAKKISSVDKKTIEGVADEVVRLLVTSKSAFVAAKWSNPIIDSEQENAKNQLVNSLAFAMVKAGFNESGVDEALKHIRDYNSSHKSSEFLKSKCSLNPAETNCFCENIKPTDLESLIKQRITTAITVLAEPKSAKKDADESRADEFLSTAFEFLNPWKDPEKVIRSHIKKFVEEQHTGVADAKTMAEHIQGDAKNVAHDLVRTGNSGLKDKEIAKLLTPENIGKIVHETRFEMTKNNVQDSSGNKVSNIDADDIVKAIRDRKNNIDIATSVSKEMEGAYINYTARGRLDYWAGSSKAAISGVTKVGLSTVPLATGIVSGAWAGAAGTICVIPAAIEGLVVGAANLSLSKGADAFKDSWLHAFDDSPIGGGVAARNAIRSVNAIKGIWSSAGDDLGEVKSRKLLSTNVREGIDSAGDALQATGNFASKEFSKVSKFLPGQTVRGSDSDKHIANNLKDFLLKNVYLNKDGSLFKKGETTNIPYLDGDKIFNLSVAHTRNAMSHHEFLIRDSQNGPYTKFVFEAGKEPLCFIKKYDKNSELRPASYEDMRAIVDSFSEFMDLADKYAALSNKDRIKYKQASRDTSVKTDIGLAVNASDFLHISKKGKLSVDSKVLEISDENGVKNLVSARDVASKRLKDSGVSEEQGKSIKFKKEDGSEETLEEYSARSILAKQAKIAQKKKLETSSVKKKASSLLVTSGQDDTISNKEVDAKAWNESSGRNAAKEAGKDHEGQKAWYQRYIGATVTGDKDNKVDFGNTFMTTFLKSSFSGNCDFSSLAESKTKFRHSTFEEGCIFPKDLSKIDKDSFVNCKFSEKLLDSFGDKKEEFIKALGIQGEVKDGYRQNDPQSSVRGQEASNLQERAARCITT